MDSTGIAALATSMSQTQIADSVQTAVLKKAMEIGAQGALQLIDAATQAVPQVTPAAVNPPNLGNVVDVHA